MASIYSEEYQLVIKELKSARKARGITQVELADALGRPQSFIAKIENGERRLDVVEFMHMARMLGIDAAGIIEKLGKDVRSIR
ncbi:helix-turn-helix domain-containing protein [Siccibacter turicensis]|uniref:helix-turn-helix domain-containing protein n=1 Tax=Siccibacter turicensis TaxID=357233 RepID=UPI003F56223D